MTTHESFYYATESPEIYSGYNWQQSKDQFNTEDVGGLPDGWPQQIKGDIAWTGEQLRKTPERYLHHLESEEIDDIHNALNYFKSLNLPLSSISKLTFPLKRLNSHLNKLSNDVFNGLGFGLIRGLDITDLSKEDRVIIFAGISSYIADHRDDQGMNRALTNIKNVLHLPEGDRAPIFVSNITNDPQMMHSDFGGQIVAMFAVAVGGTGGESILASGSAVYNELAKERPSVLKTLSKPTFKFSTQPDGASLVQYYKGRFFVNFSQRMFISFGDSPRDPSCVDLTKEQLDAFGAFHWTGYKNSLITKFQLGDLTFINNLQIQHSRYGFEDDLQNPRHLYRFWLSDKEKCPELPPEISYKFENMKEYNQLFPLDEIEDEKIRKANVTEFWDTIKHLKTDK